MKRGCLIVIGGIILLLVIASLLPETKESSRNRQMAAAIVACNEQVRARLKAPATATFPSLPDVRDKGGGVAVVISHVDAQKSFGANIRTRWICEVDVNDPQHPAVRNVVVER